MSSSSSSTSKARARGATILVLFVFFPPLWFVVFVCSRERENNTNTPALPAFSSPSLSLIIIK